jgi:hypothetical protein
MRAIRALAVLAVIALDAGVASAQSTRHFKDSWFWGAKGGAMTYQVQSDANGGLAPVVGIDWFITRTRGGLYVAYDRAFFNQFVLVNDSVSPLVVTPGGRRVDIKDMHKFSFTGMLFPLPTYRLHPYMGFGATLNSITKVTPQGTFGNNTQKNLVTATVNQFKTAAAPVVMFGAQLRLPLASAFVQFTATPASDLFFLWTGSGWRNTLEFGMRYNSGSSIERIR